MPSQKCAPCHTAAGQIGIAIGHLDMTTKAEAYANLVNTAAAGSSCAGHGTPIVPGMPASSTPADLERSARAGMRTVLPKPLVFKALCQALRPFGEDRPRAEQ